MSAPTRSPVAPHPGSALDALDQVFHDVYAERRRAALEKMGPVLAQIDDLLVLRIRNQRLEGPARTHRYHELKVISHVPITVYLTLGAGGALDVGRLATLAQRIEAVAAQLDASSWEPEVFARQRRMLERSTALVAHALASRGVEDAALRAFVREQTPDIIRNMEDAARDQLETMHATLGKWMQEMSPDERAQLQAVVGVSHMSRPGNIGVQYLSLVLGERWEGKFDREDLAPGRRVLASETTTDEATALELLATHRLDAKIAWSFFHEQSRMDRDLLADAAERLLSQMFGKTPDR